MCCNAELILEPLADCTYFRSRRRWFEETLITFNLPVGLEPGFMPGFFLRRHFFAPGIAVFPGPARGGLS